MLYLESRHGDMQRQIDQLAAGNAELCSKNRRLEAQVSALSLQTEALLAAIRQCTMSVETLISK